MILKTGDMWKGFSDPDVDLWLFTGNCIVRNDGALVMGRGLAKQVKQKFSYIPYILGGFIEQHREHNQTSYYGIMTCYHKFTYKEDDIRRELGVFQVKTVYNKPAKLSLIGFSVITLINNIEECDYKKVYLNYPGIGNGGLTEEQVFPIIKDLPDSVYVWKRR
jgi:hypothetical protein